MEKIAIVGGTGFVGAALTRKLIDSGKEVVVFTRDGLAAKNSLSLSSDREGKLEIVTYQPLEMGSWQDKISGCDAVINLAGEPIAEKRWTASQKQAILDSRQLGTQRIVEAIAKAEVKPRVLVNASAIGFYGTSETAKFDEESIAGKDFLASVCQAWEAEAKKVEALGVRLVIARLGIVLAADGGALGKMLAPFKMFVGGPIGSGQQWLSWVHRDDVVAILMAAIDRPDWQGVYNITAPQPARMNDFSQSIATALNRPAWLPVPGIALETLLGEGAIVVLQGQQVLPNRLLASDYKFTHPTLSEALKAIV